MAGWFLSSTVLVVLVLILRGLTKRQLPAMVRYLLWGIVAIRLLLPCFYPVDLSWLAEQSGIHWLAQTGFSRTESEQTKSEQTGSKQADGIPANSIPTEDSSAENAQPSPSQADSIQSDSIQSGSDQRENASSDFVQFAFDQRKNVSSDVAQRSTGLIGFIQDSVLFLLFFLWLSGAILFFSWFLWKNFRLYGVLCQKRKRLCYPELPIPVYLVEDLPSPCLFGFFHPAIYLNQFSRAPEDEAYILCHELTHYRHRDAIWAVVRVLCVAVHWFHPLVWLAAACAKRDAELACDEGTIRALGGEQAISYGEALLRMSEKMGEQKRKRRDWLMATETAFGETEMKERIVRIKNRRKKSWLLGGGVLLVALAAGFLLFARNQTIEPFHVEEILLLDGDGYALDGVRLGDSFAGAKKRLEKTPPLQGHSRVEEWKTEYQGEKQGEKGIVGLIDFQCRAELEGMYSGGTAYNFLDGRFVGGKYELTFEDYEKAIEYLQVLDQMLSENAVAARRIEPGEEYYYYNDTWRYANIQSLNDTEFLYQYWGKDKDSLQVTVRKNNISVYGEGVMWDAASFTVVYQAAEWDYWVWYSGLKPSFSEADGSLEKARDSSLRYEETTLRYLNKEESDEYLLSPNCRFLVQLDSDCWAETTIEELLHYMETISVSTKWEIGLNDQEEIEWLREKKQP